MEVDVEAVVCLQHQGSLHAGGREDGLRGVGRHGVFHQSADFRQAGDGVVILLRVVVARNPIGGVVARHGELRMLFFYYKIVEVLLVGKFVAEAQAVVVEAEAEDDAALVGGLVEGDGQLVVVVADFALLAPDGFPSFIERGGLGVADDEACHQVGFGVDEGLVLVAHFCPFEVRLLVGVFLFQFQSQGAGFDDGFVFVEKLVGGCALRVEVEVHQQVPVRRLQLLGRSQEGAATQGCGQGKFVF